MNELVKLETDALAAMNSGEFRLAISLYEKIVNENPNWEHGQAFYNLAGCYEYIGDIKAAETNYLRALSIAPKNWYFVGGYADFLDQYGDLKAAFDWYLKLLRIESESKPVTWTVENQKVLDDIKLTLYGLGEKLGWNKDEVDRRAVT